MRFASYLISLCLHAGIFLLILFWPVSELPKMDSPPIMISLVEGDPGGNKTPSPIMGHVGEEAEGPLAPTPPAPQSEIAALARNESRAPDKIPESAPEQPPAQKPEAIPVAPKIVEEPKPEEKIVPKPKEPEKPKPEEAKPEPPKKEQPKPEPPKKEPPKKEQPKKEPPKKEPPKKTPPKKPAKKVDPVAEALAQARKATSRTQSSEKGNAVEQALAQARRKAGGTRGGGGGEGAGPGGGGLGDVYVGQVMLAVRPNWGFASATRLNLSCVVKVKVDMFGKVEQAEIARSSGNPQYDASAVNAVMRTSQAGDFPPPPSQEYTDLDLVFSFNELSGR